MTDEELKRFIEQSEKAILGLAQPQSPSWLFVPPEGWDPDDARPGGDRWRRYRLVWREN